MKTSYGKLVFLMIFLVVVAYLFLPMRAGQEDRLVLSPTGLRMSVGDSYTLACRLSSDDTHQRVYFSSSDDRVASINSDGVVYGLSSGTATIRAFASGGASAETYVTVTGTPMSALGINTEELVINKGQYSGLVANYNTDATDARLQWVSADESIAVVDAAGRVYGVGGGETTVYVNAPNGLTASAHVLVNVDSIAAHMTPTNLTVGVGAQVPLKASFLPGDSTDHVRRWSSSDPGVIRMDQDGVLHALRIGSAYVSIITEDGITAGMEVKVERAPEDLQLDPTRATLDRNDTLEMQVRFLQSNGEVDHTTTHLVQWNSSNPEVASVDRDGVVTALRSGTTVITVSSDGFTASCELTVQVRVHEITLDQTEVYLLREDTAEPIRLNWTIDPADADDPTVIFTSNNEQVATVSETGVVTMSGGYGTAIITASNAGGARAEFIVNVVTRLPDGKDDTSDHETDYDMDNDGYFGDSVGAITGIEPVSTLGDDDMVGSFGDDEIGTFGDDEPIGTFGDDDAVGTFGDN